VPDRDSLPLLCCAPSVRAASPLPSGTTASLWRALLELSADGIVVTGLDGRIVDCNEVVARGLGASGREALIGAPALELVAEGDLERAAAAFARVAAGERALDEFHGWRGNADGVVATASTLVRDGGGRPLAVLTVARDLSAQRRAEEALRASEEKYRELVERQGEGIGIVDADEVFLYANSAGDAIFGVPRGGLCGRSLREFTSDSAFETVRRESARRAGGEQSTYELEIVTPAGEHRTLLVTATPRSDGDGRFLGTYGVFRDITERKRDEAEQRRLAARVQQAQKLESLGVLTGGIAHDFNNLLVPIVANASMVLAELPEGSELREPLTEIVDAARRGAELTRQMLVYAGRTGLVEARPVELGELVRESAELLALTVSRRCELRLELAPGLPTLAADSGQLRQVLVNLVANASEASEATTAGAIEVRTGVRHCDRRFLAGCHLGDGLCEGSYVFVAVADRGCGMGAEARARMFEPFFSTKFTGRGLGLSAVEDIVRRLRGAVHVESEVGRGSTVTVLLPPIDLAAPRPAADTVLLIDDDPHVLSATRRLLARNGFGVLAAASGPEGVALYRAHRGTIGAVLLDLTLPQMGGREIFAALKAVDPDARVILTSGFDEPSAVAALEGLAGFIQKPYRAEDLVDAVRRVVGRGG
jgi:PAS domain S-box-containing protein